MYNVLAEILPSSSSGRVTELPWVYRLSLVKDLSICAAGTPLLAFETSDSWTLNRTAVPPRARADPSVSFFGMSVCFKSFIWVFCGFSISVSDSEELSLFLASVRRVFFLVFEILLPDLAFAWPDLLRRPLSTLLTSAKLASDDVSLKESCDAMLSSTPCACVICLSSRPRSAKSRNPRTKLGVFPKDKNSEGDRCFSWPTFKSSSGKPLAWKDWCPVIFDRQLLHRWMWRACAADISAGLLNIPAAKAWNVRRTTISCLETSVSTWKAQHTSNLQREGKASS